MTKCSFHFAEKLEFEKWISFFVHEFSEQITTITAKIIYYRYLKPESERQEFETVFYNCSDHLSGETQNILALRLRIDQNLLETRQK